MKSLLPLLMYAAFFYLMMRFGCGAHMIHGHDGHDHHGKGGNSTDEASARDPVCGMTVRSGQGYSENHQGRTLRFCSKQCLDKFDAEPQRYLA